MLNHEGCLILDHEGCLVLNREGCLILEDRGWRGILLLRERILLRLMLGLWKEEVHEGHKVENLLGGGRWSVERGRQVVA